MVNNYYYISPVASLLITGGGGGGGVIFLRFWTFSGFKNWSSQWLSRGNLDFYRADYAVARCLFVCLSVRPSVRLFVCPSQVGIVPKRLYISSKYFHRRVAVPF